MPDHPCPDCLDERCMSVRHPPQPCPRAGLREAEARLSRSEGPCPLQGRAGFPFDTHYRID